MKEKLKIHEITPKILTDLQKKNYADNTVGSYGHCYNGLHKYVEASGMEYYSAKVGIDYIRNKCGIIVKGLLNVRSCSQMITKLLRKYV